MALTICNFEQTRKFINYLLFDQSLSYHSRENCRIMHGCVDDLILVTHCLYTGFTFLSYGRGASSIY